MSKYTNGKKVIENLKEYNKNYYSQNKASLLNKAYKKETCDLCGRDVCHVNMRRHKKTPLCKRRQQEQAEDEAEFDRIEQLEAEAEAQYFKEKEEEYWEKMEEQQKLEEYQQQCYIVDSDDEYDYDNDDDDDIIINDNQWDLKEENKNVKLHDSLTEFFKKMNQLEQKLKDKKITQEEYYVLFKYFIEEQAKIKI